MAYIRRKHPVRLVKHHCSPTGAIHAEYNHSYAPPPPPSATYSPGVRRSLGGKKKTPIALQRPREGEIRAGARPGRGGPGATPLASLLVGAYIWRGGFVPAI